MSDVADDSLNFESLDLAAPVLQAVKDAGFETPSPIQAQSIPHLLAGRDLLGQAQTGTGKTAAFALPLLSRIDASSRDTQLLVLAPTRELALQVADAFEQFASHLKGMQVLAIYGGQSYETQLRALRRGVQVVVGTPGRVMDHIRRGTLKLEGLRALVLDEADEMLRMGFIDDVEWILEQTPETRQTALFSATMPGAIRKVANTYLNEPEEVKIAAKTTTATTIRQRCWMVGGMNKIEALSRILEVEDFDATLIFVRTKNATVELAEQLNARGYACDALNGDIPQHQRERSVERLKNGKLDILVATDVAARGLDVDRISLVVNYDIPYDTESYVHRIGRTGRAGRQGDAILFVTHKEKRMLKAIERATRQTIEHMEVPTGKVINEHRIRRFKQQIADTMAGADTALFEGLLSEFQSENDADPMQIAAALACIAQGEKPLLVSEKEPKRREERPAAQRRERPSDRPARRKREVSMLPVALKDHPDVAMERYRLAVGYDHGVKPGNIVGAVANEAEIDSCYIGQIQIYDDFATIDLPEGMPRETFQTLKKTRVCGQMLDIKPLAQAMEAKSQKSQMRHRRNPDSRHKGRKQARAASA